MGLFNRGFDFTGAPNIDEIVEKNKAYDAEEASREAVLQVKLLVSEVERLYMITEAMWMVMKKKWGYTDKQLESLIQKIDARDGKLDGKAKQKSGPATCGQCKRVLSKNRPVCIYCGTKQVSEEVFKK
jgi:hypothetical protein